MKPRGWNNLQNLGKQRLNFTSHTTRQFRLRVKINIFKTELGSVSKLFDVCLRRHSAASENINNNNRVHRSF
jgi:hypothetical protein